MLPNEHHDDAGMPQTYRQIVETRCRDFPDSVYFEYIEEGELHQRTGAEFHGEVMALGTALWERGFANAHIGILGRNSYAWALFFSAILFGKSVAVPLNIAAPREVITRQIRHSDAKLLIYDDEIEFAPQLAPEVESIPMSALPELLREGRELLAQGKNGFADYRPQPEQLAFIMYTSGTTGNPKGVMISNQTSTSQARIIGEAFPVHGKSFPTLPFFHIGDIIVGLQAYPLLGNTIFISKEPKNMFSDMQKAKPFVADFVPMVLEGICKRISSMGTEEAKAFLGGNLRAIVCGGGNLDDAYRKMLADLGVSLIYVYGMTEFSVFVAAATPAWYRPGSVGKPVPGVTVRIDNPDKDGNGEIVARKNFVMSGYYKNPEETARVLDDGWFHTGDIGKVDEDGFVYITGRLKNLIILSNGENVAPEELEEPLLRNPYIEECLVHEQNGAIAATIYPCLAHAAKAGLSGQALFHKIQDDVDALNKTLSLSRHIKIITLTEEPLPKTASGKLKRGGS